MKAVSLSGTLGSVVLLFVSLVTINVIASFIPLRFDLQKSVSILFLRVLLKFWKT